MKFGCCLGTNIERAYVLKREGFDFAELNVNAFANLEESPFSELLEGMKGTGIACEAACCFIPSEIKLVGPLADWALIRDYTARAVYRSNLFGIRTIVFGSGGARRIPDGMTREDGLKDIVAFLRDVAAPEAEKYGIEIAIEPLGFKECNAINTVDQGIAVAEETGRANVKTLADIYHMLRSNDPIEALAEKKGKVIHAHTSCPFAELGKRTYPSKHDEDFDQFDFMNPLYLAGCERYSIEANSGEHFEAEAAEAIAVMKEVYERVLAANK